MSISCESCGNDTFTDMVHEYYAGCWSFTCAECGSTLTIYEDLSGE